MGSLAGVTCLIVEDEAMIAMVIEDTLASLGCADIRIIGALNDALAEIESRAPDVAILDVNLAGTPGFPAAEKLAALGKPFIFTTGYGLSAMPAEWSSSPVLAKPFDPDALGAAVIALLNR